METTKSSETLVSYYITTRRHDPSYHDLNLIGGWLDHRGSSEEKENPVPVGYGQQQIRSGTIILEYIG